MRPHKAPERWLQAFHDAEENRISKKSMKFKNYYFLVIMLITLFLSFTANAQQLGTKETLKQFDSYLSYLKAPDFFYLLEKTKQPVKKEAATVYVFNGFSEGKHLKWGFLQCSFDVYEYKKGIHTDEFGQREYSNLVSSTYYVYKNQKIIYKKIEFKKNDKDEEITIEYYNDGKPKTLYSKLANTEWHFDKKGAIAKVGYDKYGNTVVLYDVEREKKFVFDNSKFTIDERLKIRKELLNMINSTNIPGKGFDDYTVTDWKIANKTKKYLKTVFDTDMDLYLDGIAATEIMLYSEYGEYYALTDSIKKLQH